MHRDLHGGDLLAQVERLRKTHCQAQAERAALDFFRAVRVSLPTAFWGRGLVMAQGKPRIATACTWHHTLATG